MNVDVDNDRTADINIDTNGDNKADTNIDTDGNSVADLNIDIDKNGTPDVNIDTNGDNKPDYNLTNTDSDNNRKPDVNVDTNKDGYPDVNIDIDGDGKPDINIDTNRNGVADLNIDIDKNGTPDVNVDTNGDSKPDHNLTNTDSDNNGRIDLNIDIDGDGYPDINIDIDGDGIPDLNIDAIIPDVENEEKVEALVTIVGANSINLTVSAKDLTKDSIGNKEYVDILSNIETTKVALKSNADKTTCKYKVEFITKENSFENKYIMNNGNTGVLNNQIILQLNGYKTEKGITSPITYYIDLNEYKDKNFIIKDLIISNGQKENSTTTQKWDMNLIFRNYRDYNQDNSIGKKLVGEIKFEITECERTK